VTGLVLMVEECRAQPLDSLAAGIMKVETQIQRVASRRSRYLAALQRLRADVLTLQLSLDNAIRQLEGREDDYSDAEVPPGLQGAAVEARAVLQGYREILAHGSSEEADVATFPPDDLGDPGTEIDGFGELVQATVENRLEGVEFEAVYTADVFSNVDGGVQRGSGYLDNVDLTIAFDAEKLFGWSGAVFSLYVLGNQGDSPTDYIGDAQGVSNIDADDTWKIYEAWLQQELWSGKVSLLAGLYDLNSEFDVMETAGLFLNSSHGIGPDFSQTGRNGPSIFPATSLGLRVRFQPTGNTYFQTVVLDGVPGNPDNPNGTQIVLDKKDGLLLTGEVGWSTEAGPYQSYRKVALGGYLYTSKFDALIRKDAVGNPARLRGRPGFYVLAEGSVLREDDPEQGLAMFARFGVADDAIYQLSAYLGAGMAYTGLLPGRDQDLLGVAVATARNGHPFKLSMLNTGTSVEAYEVALELTYRVALFPWLVAQPDVQYIINPGTERALSNALLISSRFEITL